MVSRVVTVTVTVTALDSRDARLRNLLHRRLAAVVALAAVGVVLLGNAVSVAQAEPERPDPYPELRYFNRVDPEPFRLPNGQGVWFVTAHGLNCGIWWRGSFGCSGDIPGAPQDVHHIGWHTGDTRVHYDWTMAIRFPQSKGSLALPPLSFIESDGTTCATTVDGSTYCERGPWRLLITPTQTWLNG